MYHQLSYLAENSKCKKKFCNCGTDVAQFFHREMRKHLTSAEMKPTVGNDVGSDVGSAVVVGDHEVQTDVGSDVGLDFATVDPTSGYARTPSDQRWFYRLVLLVLTVHLPSGGRPIVQTDVRPDVVFDFDAVRWNMCIKRKLN